MYYYYTPNGISIKVLSIGDNNSDEDKKKIGKFLNPTYFSTTKVDDSESSSAFHCTKMYPMALICLLPLSPPCLASFPHVFLVSGYPPVPNPILESGEPQFLCSLPMIPILALELWILVAALNPSLLQWRCKEPWEPISDFHVSRPSEVARYTPSAIRECNEFACWLMTINLICWPIFIPRQILEKDVFQ